MPGELTTAFLTLRLYQPAARHVVVPFDQIEDYVVAGKADAGLLETWAYPLTLGQALPTLPLWLTDKLAVPLELEECYEETCRVLRIP